MRELFLTLCCLFSLHFCLLAQTADSLAVDTSEVYKITDEPAYFPACVELPGGKSEKLECTNKQVLAFMYKYLQYPLQALKDSLEGQVVVRFVVEKDGKISNPDVLRDIGGGCGEEVVRVINGLNSLPKPWVAAKVKGEAVRSYFTVPVRFKLPKYEEPEFTVDGRDTIWLKFDTPSTFQPGEDALQSYVGENLRYPEEGVAKCVIGEMDVQFLVQPNGKAKLVELLDYSGIGLDYWYEAVALVHSMHDKWTVAQYKGRPVATAQNLRLTFAPPTQGCQQRVEEYKLAQTNSNEAINKFEAGETDEAIKMWNNAIGLFPNNSEWLSYRGQAFMNGGQLGLACQDLTKAQQILQVFWYKDILGLICKPSAEAGAQQPALQQGIDSSEEEALKEEGGEDGQ
ncbi:MAG: energy transducer TonB [Bacteroidota bacterium]